MTHHDPRAGLTSDQVASLLLDSAPYLSCDECFERLDAYAEAVLADPRHTDVPLQVHLSACGVCAQEARSLVELLALDG
ncbi:MAG: hypothetical protein DCC50_11145 [Acidobacteria bacterium]|nr:MAG: hypothetical protein DCC50_11145 [Acidobacteriota bacterium]